jgi:hypothetical protein
MEMEMISHDDIFLWKAGRKKNCSLWIGLNPARLALWHSLPTSTTSNTQWILSNSGNSHVPAHKSGAPGLYIHRNIWGCHVMKYYSSQQKCLTYMACSASSKTPLLPQAHPHLSGVNAETTNKDGMTIVLVPGSTKLHQLIPKPVQYLLCNSFDVLWP